MKKKIWMLALFFCLILPISFVFTGCGEQFIIEGEYKLINAQVIRDNSYLYSPDSDGEFVTHITGGMTLDKCSVIVGVEESQLIFTDEENKVKALFTFVRYNDASQYPAFKCDSVAIWVDGVDVTTLTEEEKAELTAAQARLLSEVSHVANNFSTNVTSLQLVTFNQTFTCHLIVKTITGELKLMAIVYGY